MILRLASSFCALLLLGRLCYAADVLSPEPKRGLRDENKQPVRRDAHGDPLPKNATVRLGTLRLRQSEPTTTLAYSHDGKLLASSTYYSRAVRLWNAVTGEEVALVYSPEVPQGFQEVLFFPDRRSLLYRTRDGLRKWDLPTKRSSPMPIDLSPIVLSSKGELAAGGGYHSFVIYDLKKQAVHFERVGMVLYAVDFSPDGKLVATSEKGGSGGRHAGGTIRFWDVGTAKQVGEEIDQGGQVKSLCFSSDGNVLASAGREGVVLWDVASHRRLARLEATGRVLTFAPNGKLLAVGGRSNEVHLWDLVTHKLVRSIQTGAGEVRSLAFSPDGKKIVTGGSWHALQLWELETGRQLQLLSGHEHSVLSLQFAPDGKTLASYGDDLSVRLWDIKTKKEQRRFLLGTQGVICQGQGSAVPACSLAFSPNGKTLVAIGVPKAGVADNPVHLWDVASGNSVLVIQTPRPKSAGFRPLAIAFSPDGQMLATVDGSIQLWSAVSATQLRVFPGGRIFPFRSLALSADGRALAAGRFGPQIEFWDWSTGRLMRSVSCSKEAPTCMVFSPGGHMLASTSSCVGRHLSQSDSKIQLRETETGTLLRTLDGKESSAACVAFSPNGRLLASAGQHDQMVRIWDVFTGKELANFTGHRGPVYCVAFSPDGKTVASGSADTTILLWDVSKIQPERPPPISPDELQKELARLWDEMQAKEGAKAYQAIWKMLAAGDEAVAFLARKLHPVPFPDAKLLKQALADLDSNDFNKREAGNAHLTKLGELAEPALRQALQAQPSLEMRKRIERILAEMPLTTSTEELRQIRAVHALELIGTPAARDLLKKLVGGAPGARLTRDANLAVQRLERRAPKP